MYKLMTNNNKLFLTLRCHISYLSKNCFSANALQWRTFRFFCNFFVYFNSIIIFLNLSTKHDKMSLKRKQGRVSTGLF